MPSNQPIDNIVWKKVEDLHANHWNPNVVYNTELSLLERSIISTGWIQPILISRDGMVIDGFHRWALSKSSPKLYERFAGMVPCAVLDVDESEAMMTTVRINRAKGAHIGQSMSKLVQALIDVHKLEVEEIAKGIGALTKEVELLYQNDLWRANKYQDAKYSRAWVPEEGSPTDPAYKAEVEKMMEEDSVNGVGVPVEGEYEHEETEATNED